jgi:hypothetical protein
MPREILFPPETQITTTEMAGYHPDEARRHKMRMVYFTIWPLYPIGKESGWALGQRARQADQRKYAAGPSCQVSHVTNRTAPAQ